MSKNKRFTKEQKDFLLEMLKDKTPQEVCDLFYEKFNRQTCVGSLINLKCRYNKDRKSYSKCNLSEEQKKWLLNKIPYYSPIVIADMFKEKFNQDIKVGNIRNLRFYSNNRGKYQRKIFDMRYRDKIKKPLYNEITDNRGRDYVRVGNKKYQIKRRYVWEQYYGRKIPKGYEVIFLDNDKTNYDIKNLALIKKGLRIYMLKKKIEPTNRDIIKAASLCFELDKKIRECEKNGRSLY